MRIRSSGDRNADKQVARRVYVAAAQIVALPVILVAPAHSSMYADPVAMAAAPLRWWDVATLGFPFYSFVVSFIGVRTVFDVRPGLAALCFLILPSVVVGGAILALIAAVLLTKSVPPDLDTPRTHLQSGISFSYPSNWDLQNDSEGDFLDLTIEPTQDAFMRVSRYSTSRTEEFKHDATLGQYRETFSDLVTVGSFNALGTMTDFGGEHTFSHGLYGAYILRTFVSDGGRGVTTEIVTMCLESDRELVEPGFELIYTTLR